MKLAPRQYIGIPPAPVDRLAKTDTVHADQTIRTKLKVWVYHSFSPGR